MNKAEYEQYETSVQAFFDKEGITNLSTTDGMCEYCEEEVDPDPFFSYLPCECCGGHLGGDRYHATGYDPKRKKVYCYNVCQDCPYYAEYGELDDQTMLDIAEG